jgi:hypothetical protein
VANATTKKREKQKTMTTPINLYGVDGNALSIVAFASSELRKAGRSDEVEAFRAEALSGDYDNVLQTVFAYFDVDFSSDDDDDNDEVCNDCQTDVALWETGGGIWLCVDCK